MDLGIRGRKAIVCASSRGLGKARATALAREGYSVVDMLVNNNAGPPPGRCDDWKRAD